MEGPLDYKGLVYLGELPGSVDMSGGMTAYEAVFAVTCDDGYYYRTDIMAADSILLLVAKAVKRDGELVCVNRLGSSSRLEAPS